MFQKYLKWAPVPYSNRIKNLLIHVPNDMLAEYGAVSEQVAKAMAEGVCKTAGSTYGIGITGIAGPGGGTAENRLDWSILV